MSIEEIAKVKIDLGIITGIVRDEIPDDLIEEFEDELQALKKAIIARVVMPHPRQPQGYA